MKSGIDVLIHSPYPLHTSQGNSVTAMRLERILKEGGLRVAMEAERYQGAGAKCMVALNARRSAQAVKDFKADCPESQVVLVLTGTDMNHPEMNEVDSPTRRTISVADALVTLHDAAFSALPADLQKKAVVIYPSVSLPEGLSHEGGGEGGFLVVMVGNLRKEKNLGLALDAWKSVRGVELVIYGDADEATAEQISDAEEETDGIYWAGKVSHEVVLREMSRADLLLNTSTQEGGANAICEAVVMGLPVLASEIQGNIGMLGRDYAGFFPVGDAKVLAQRVMECAEGEDLYRTLKTQVAERAGLFSYETEAGEWLRLFEGGPKSPMRALR